MSLLLGLLAASGIAAGIYICIVISKHAIREAMRRNFKQALSARIKKVKREKGTVKLEALSRSGRCLGTIKMQGATIAKDIHKGNIVYV